MTEVFVLGGAQTDFARNYTREGKGLFEMMGDAVSCALEDARVSPSEVEASHVGNFVGERFAHQGHLGGFFAALHPAFDGLPSSRHEAACASGSVAILAALAELRAGMHDCIVVVGAELMRNVKGDEAADHLASAAWYGKEATDAKFLWPAMFSKLADEYETRYGLDPAHLRRIAEINFANAKKNPNAQTRGWAFTPESFTDDDAVNPIIEGRMRKHDCSQVTDGAAAVVLASSRFAETWAKRVGFSLDEIPRVLGYGHRTSTMRYDDKVRASKADPYVFPEVRKTILDAFARAGVSDVTGIDAIETHDCFTPTEYMAIDHFGITPPGQSFRAIEDGSIALGGRIPINPSGGLIGVGHPVGATGVRMLIDASKQVTGRAGESQVEGAKKVATLNIGGSATTICSFVVGKS
jgi:acetyl-CoA C-acetyltransferase